MRTILFIATLVMGSQAFASMDNSLNLNLPGLHKTSADSTYYDTLVDWFNNGTNITADDFRRDIYSGRCFKDWKKDAPLSSALVTYQDSNGDVGPGLPRHDNSPFYFNLLYAVGDTSPSFFDFRSDIDLMRDTVRSIIAKHELSPAGLNHEGSVSSNMRMIDNRGRLVPDAEFSIKRYDNYLVVRKWQFISVSDWDMSSNTIKIVPDGPGAVQYCYYFKRLTP
jgi:hypothetical protein